MAIDEPFLLRAAGWSAIGAIAALVLAGITIALFFGGAGAQYGPLNDLFSALGLALLALPIVAVWWLVRGETGPWFGVVSLLALAGIVIAAGGQLLLVAGAISLETSFVTGGVGLVPLLIWAVALAVVAFRSDALADVLGWLTLAALALIVLTAIVGSMTSGPAVVVLSGLLLAVLVGWLLALAPGLLARA